MIKLRQAIVVEGRYDKNTLAQIVDAPIFETGGFGVMRNKELLAFLRRVAEKRGLIILTDSDGAGFVIRNYLKGALPKEHVLHAYIPDVCGKERRKAQPGKEGKLGVEGLTPQILVDSLRRAGATIEGENSPGNGGITKQDLMERGLSGGADAGAKRQQLLKKLGLPERMSTNAMLQALNLLCSMEELDAILEQM